MVDYSKFDHIGSSDESDAAHPVSIQQTCDAMFDSIRRVGPGQPKGFYYPLQGGDMVPFDVRDEICQDLGYQHGDVVVTDHGHISTVIGVFDEQLWFHAEGNDGADLWTNEALKKVGRTAVEERAKGPPSLKSDWLRLDFAYAAGLENPTLAYFDTRKHLCETVGGFKHGDVIRVGAISAVTIGVKRDGHRLFLWFHPPHSPGARIFQVEDLRGSRVIDRKAVREHPRPHAVPAPANKKAAECAPMGIKAAQRDSDTNKAKLVAKLVAERGAREEAERKLREAEKEVDKMRKKLDRLRSKNSSLAKASATSERNTERKFLLKREQVRKELEVETSQKLMNELIQPQLDDLQKKERILQQEQAVVARERHSISEQSFELEAKKRQLQQRLESNDVDTQRLREELKRREAESLRLRSETKHLEQRIHEEKAARVAEKAELVRQLRSQPPASVDEETWQYQNDEGDWVSYSSRSNDELMGALKEGKKSIILTIDQKGYEVDFTLMKQMNQRTEKRRSIRLFFGLPNHWGIWVDMASLYNHPFSVLATTQELRCCNVKRPVKWCECVPSTPED